MKNHSKLKSIVSMVLVAILGLSFSSIGYAQKPKEIKLTINKENINLQTKAKTVNEVLEDMNYDFIEGSRINHSLDSQVEDDMKIEIETTKDITINHGNNIVKTKTFASNVKEVLEEEDIVVGKNDKLSPSIDAEIQDGDTIKIDIFKFKNYTKEKTLDFKTINEDSNSLYKGETKIKQEGQEGLKTFTYKKTFKNGELISDELVKEKVTKKPVNKIILNGTKEKPKPVVKAPSQGPAINNSSSFDGASRGVMMMNATAYTPDPAENGGYSGTALGTPLRRGVVAVDPSVIPLGTRLYIEGYGYARAEDTGGAIRGNKIDLLFMTRSEAYSFGRRTVKVHILG